MGFFFFFFLECVSNSLRKKNDLSIKSHVRNHFGLTNVRTFLKNKSEVES